MLLNHALRLRFFIAAGLLVASFFLLRGVSHGEATALRRPLQELPLDMAEWRGQERPFEKRVVDALGVDDYSNRSYMDPNGDTVELYVGYYRSQRTGETIHSPKNCLPGAGWEPVRAGRITILVAFSPPITVNEYVIQKDRSRYLVLYWYHAHGRVVASEYSGKVWLVLDAITRNRTDGALVRIVTPMRDGEEKARARAVDFVLELYPQLGEFIPD